MSADKTKKNDKSTAAKGDDCQACNKKLPLIIGVVVIAAIALGMMFMSSRNGVAQNEGADAEIATKTGEGDAPMIKLGNPVVAVVYDKEINRSDVFNFISNLPENVRQMPIQNLFPLALDQVVNNHVISEKAKNADLAEDKEVTELVDQAKEQIVRNVYLERQVDAAVTQKKLLASYEKLLKDISEIEETKARHILVEDEETAKAVIAELDGGADFVELAKEKSTGPSAERGGDLGYFAKNQMVPEFADVAFSLDKGAYTKDPVKTQFGWHVIKVEDRRNRPEPKFEDVKPQLEAQLRQQILADLVQDWQKEAKIQKFDINGEKVNN
jgi:peptidyl-prolyl cis-trans isomerase C